MGRQCPLMCVGSSADPLAGVRTGCPEMYSPPDGRSWGTWCLFSELEAEQREPGLYVMFAHVAFFYLVLFFIFCYTKQIQFYYGKLCCSNMKKKFRSFTCSPAILSRVSVSSGSPESLPVGAHLASGSRGRQGPWEKGCGQYGLCGFCLVEIN